MKTLLIAPHNDDETLFCSHAITRHGADLLVVYDSYVQLARDRRLPLEKQRYLPDRPKVTMADRIFDQIPDAESRRGETRRAVFQLTGKANRMKEVRFAGLNDAMIYSEAQIAAAIRLALGVWDYDRIFAPAIEEGGHEQHNAVGAAAAMLRPFGCASCHWGADNTLPECPICKLPYDPMRRGPEIVRYLTYTRQAGKSTFGMAIDLSAEETLRKIYALASYWTQIDRDDCRPHFQRSLMEYIDVR